MTTDKRALIPIYEMSVKEIEGYIKCFDVNVQTWVIIVRADQVQGALKSRLQRHGSCLHRLDKGAKISLRKGWWQTGERTKIKAQQSHEIWVSKSLENERATFQASDIESNLRWTPDRINASPCLQRYLDALPSGEYFGKGYQVVATDGSLRLNRSSTKEPAMGAGVMWHDAAIPHRSERVGGQHSSTRAELAAVVMALQGTPRADDLAILIDSAAAIQRLRWFRSHDFRPAEHKVKDHDIIHDILLELKLRSDSSSRTLFVKVHGHSGDPLHEEADRLAVEGADKESDNENILYPRGRGQEMVFNWADGADKSKSHTWCSTVKKRIKAHEEKMSWQTRSRKTHAEEFLARPNAARPQLGVALRSIWDWAVRAWMLSLTPGQSPVKSNLKKWGLTATAQCDCGQGDETFLHQQLHCHLTHRRNMKQTAHNNVAKVIENQVQHINPETRHAQWDRKVLTFLTHSANANTLKVSNHSTRSPKRKLDELLKPFDDTTSSQRPDGLIEDTKLKHIYIIEVARTDDFPDSLLRAHVKKMCTYNSLLHALRRAFPQYVVKQQNYVIEIQGSAYKDPSTNTSCDSNSRSSE